MRSWFNCKVKFLKESEDGKISKVTEPYLIDAMSFTEAEARVYEELGSYVRGEFQVTGISKARIVEVFHYEDSDVWYQGKVTYVDFDESSGKEKKVTNNMLVTASNVREAYDRLRESLKQLLADFDIPAIAQSPLVDIFPYVSEEDREQEIPDNLTPVSEVQAEDSSAFDDLNEEFSAEEESAEEESAIDEESVEEESENEEATEEEETEEAS